MGRNFLLKLIFPLLAVYINKQTIAHLIILKPKECPTSFGSWAARGAQFRCSKSGTVGLTYHCILSYDGYLIETCMAPVTLRGPVPVCFSPESKRPSGSKVAEERNKSLPSTPIQSSAENMYPNALNKSSDTTGQGDSNKLTAILILSAFQMIFLFGAIIWYKSEVSKMKKTLNKFADLSFRESEEIKRRDMDLHSELGKFIQLLKNAMSTVEKLKQITEETRKME